MKDTGRGTARTQVPVYERTLYLGAGQQVRLEPCWTELRVDSGLCVNSLFAVFPPAVLEAAAKVRGGQK